MSLILNEDNPFHRPTAGRIKIIGGPGSPTDPDPQGESFLGEIRSILSWFDLLYLSEPATAGWFIFFALTSPLPELTTLRQRLGLSKRMMESVKLCRVDGEKALKIINRSPRISRSEIHRLLSPLPNEVLLYLMAKTNQETTRKAISLFFTQLKSIRVSIGGEDLKALGLAPGPQFKFHTQRTAGGPHQ